MHLQRRIFGIETEYGLTCTAPDGSRRLSPDDAARYLFRSVVAKARSSNVFLTNGSRLYLDVGSHPEYATCEVDDIEAAIAHERAGDHILNDMVRTAEAQLRAEDIDGTIYLFKNNTDSAGNSYGCHENYLIARTGQFADMARHLVPFFITRQLIAGAGKIVHTPKGAHFQISQRAEHMWDGVSSATTRSRPIINTRDEPHADAETYRRLHVIVGDSSMSQTTTMLKLASTHALLRFLEDRRTLPDLTMENPIRAIRETALDPTGRTIIRLANGTTIRALEIQQTYCDAVTRHAQETGTDTGIIGRALELWARTLNAIASDRLGDVATEIDWVIKRTVLDRYCAKHGLDLADPRVAQLELAYHDISPQRGLFLAMERKGLVARVVEDAAIEAAVTIPPQSTRAKLRGDFVAAAEAAGVDYAVDWTQLKVTDHTQRSVLIKDPFAAVDPRVDRLIHALQ